MESSSTKTGKVFNLGLGLGPQKINKIAQYRDRKPIIGLKKRHFANKIVKRMALLQVNCDKEFKSEE